jgi:hypothetical protein
VWHIERKGVREIFLHFGELQKDIRHEIFAIPAQQIRHVSRNAFSRTVASYEGKSPHIGIRM